MIVARYLNKKHFDATFSPGHGMPWLCLLCLGKAFEKFMINELEYKICYLKSEEGEREEILKNFTANNDYIKTFHFSFWILSIESILDRLSSLPCYEYPSNPLEGIELLPIPVTMNLILESNDSQLFIFPEQIKVVHFDSMGRCSVHTQGTNFWAIWRFHGKLWSEKNWNFMASGDL